MPDPLPSFFYEYRPATETAILAEPVVLIPGWGFTHHCWGPFAEQLNRFAHVILVDWPELPSGIHASESMLAAIFAEWETHFPQNAVYLGWSLGGMVVERWASAYPHRVSRWIALGANAQFVADAHWPTAMSEATFERFSEQVKDDWGSAGKYFIRLATRQADLSPRASDQRQSPKRGKAEHIASQKLLQAALMDSAEQANRYLRLLSGLTSKISWKSDIATPLDQKPSGLQFFAECDGLVPVAAAEKMRVYGTVHTVSSSHAMHLSATQFITSQVQSFLKDGQFFCPKARIAQSFSRAARTYDSVAHLQRRVAANLMDQWQTVVQPDELSVILDVGCGTGALLPHIEQALGPCSTNNASCTSRRIISLDLAEGMVSFARQKSQLPEKSLINDQTDKSAPIDENGHIDKGWLCADGESLPLVTESVDGIVSSLVVQWCSNLPRLLQEWWRVLRPGGTVAIATLGDRSLWQLREAWRVVDEHTHVNRFEPLEAWHSHWQTSPLELIHQSTHDERLWFDDLRQLSHELKALGAHNMNAGKPSGLTGRKRLLALQQTYEGYREAKGLPLDYEIHYFFAKKSESRSTDRVSSAQ